MEVTDLSQPKPFSKAGTLRAPHSIRSMMDTDIKEEYELLINAIGALLNSIESEESPYLHPGEFRHNPDGFYDLVHLGLFKDTRSDLAWMKWLTRQATCNSVIVSIDIWNFLNSSIFGRYFPIGVEYQGKNEWETLLRKTTDAIQAREPTNERGRARSLNLRSEVMKAIVIIPETLEARESARPRLLRGLTARLAQWIRKDTLAHHEIMIQTKILDAAIELHQGMKCAQNEYEFRSVCPDRGSKPEEAENWNLRNITTWISTKYSTINGIFHPLFPSLWRKGLDRKDDIELVKPVVIAYKTPHPLRKPKQLTPPRKKNERSTSSRSRTFPLDTTTRRYSEQDRRASRGKTTPPRTRSSSEVPEGEKDTMMGHRRRRSVRPDPTRTSNPELSIQRLPTLSPPREASPSKPRRSKTAPGRMDSGNQSSSPDNSESDESSNSFYRSEDEEPPPPLLRNYGPNWGDHAIYYS
ncbi:hypothetical protein F5Y04DRAFT_289385 [Hypomontagnella monticulosa]|nr:hypothetical protein F5Y04DRAFT_289385 [Hypomontagnella monticulosa]